MNTKQIQKPKKKPKKKVIRTNTPREKGQYISYSLRIPKRDLDKIKKASNKEKISVNTWVLTLFKNHFDPPVPVEEIDDPSKYREGQAINGEAVQD